MAPYPSWLRNRLLAGYALALPVLALEVPAGTPLQVRLKTKIASNTSKPDDPVETMVIAPVMVNSALAIPAGVTLRGVVTAASAASDLAEIWVRPDSHRLTVANETPRRRASCSWLSPRRRRSSLSRSPTEFALLGPLTIAAYGLSAAPAGR